MNVFEYFHRMKGTLPQTRMPYTVEQIKQILNDAVRVNYAHFPPELNGGKPLTREQIASMTDAPLTVADVENLIAQLEGGKS